MKMIRSRFFISFFLPTLWTGLAAPALAQTLSVRSVVKWPLHDELKRAIGGGVQLRADRKVLLDFEVAAGTEHSSSCGGLVLPGQDCSPVDRDLSFVSALVGFPVAFTTSQKWYLGGAPLAGISMLNSYAATTHLTLGFGLVGDRQVVRALRLGAAARASILMPPFRTRCEDCAEPRRDVIQAFDLGVVVSFQP